MSVDTYPPGSRPDESASPARRSIGGRDFSLQSVVVNYEGRPDRCTIYPRKNRCQERVASWLSADLDAFVGLEEMR